ncbi:MAG: hypothetical protein E7335_08215 [Clostridiales bacterium]|nr:hypothetical protein [Clostridiales bacterium]
MSVLDINQCISSFYYGDAKVNLIPAKMNKVSGNVFEHLMDDGLCAILEIAQTDKYFTVLLKFEHRGSADSGRIHTVRSLDFSIPGATACWRTLTGDDCGAKSYNPLEKSMLPGDTIHVEPSGGCSCSITGFPFFDIEADGATYIFGIGWSGQWSQDITMEQEACRVEVGLVDADFYLHPGESVRAPMVLCVPRKEAYPAARRAFRSILQESFCPGRDLLPPVALQPFDRYFNSLGLPPEEYDAAGLTFKEFWTSEKGQIMCVDAAVRCKYMDTLWLDAAWFKVGFPEGVGNYTFCEGFPNGLKPVTDYAHEKGLKFVLWFEPERVDRRSDLALEHPEMLLSHPDEPNNRLFRMGDDTARAWLKDTLIRVIRDNGIDVYRQDFNIAPRRIWLHNDEPGRKGLTEMRHVAGMYDLWDTLLASCPGLVIDNCSGGGRRIDLETTRRAIPLWRSDTGCFPVTSTHRVHTWSQNHTLALMEYLPYTATATWSTEVYHIRSAQSGGLACNFDILNPGFDFEATHAPLKELNRVRKYWSGVFYPLTKADNSEKIWAAWQFDLNGDGVVYAFRRDECPDESFTLLLSAIDAAAEYSVSITDERMNENIIRMTGTQLASLTVSTPGMQESLLIEYKKL